MCSSDLITKSEVRAVVMSKLALQETDIAYDIGAGTGSVTVEMALGAEKGHIYAMECNPTAIALIEKNTKKFGCKNVSILEGYAKDYLATLPLPRAVFIGGTKGELPTILATLKKRCVAEGQPSCHIVLTAITLETLQEALEGFKTYGLTQVDMCQVAITKIPTVGSFHMLQAHNPIFILSGDMVSDVKEVADANG